MKLLIDTDAFCKLGVAGLLPKTSRVFGTKTHQCGRLPALPYMLRERTLRENYGKKACDELIGLAESMPVFPPPGITWLERLTPIDEIDPGEVQLLAAAADSGLTVLTGDKRALRALKNVADIVALLAGRVAVMEAVLIALYDDLGQEELRRCLVPLSKSDKVVKICFSKDNSDPHACLASYFEALADEVKPLVLWNPESRDHS